MSAAHTVCTIGYEGTTVAEFLEVLRKEHVSLLVDVRAIAGSRRPGFAKTRLAAHLADVGIEYLHLRGLGTPGDGRAAARAGRHAAMHAIFRAHLATPVAQADLATLMSIVGSGRRVCVLCLESDPAHCHRSLIVAEMQQRIPLDVLHLHPITDTD